MSNPYRILLPARRHGDIELLVSWRQGQIYWRRHKRHPALRLHIEAAGASFSGDTNMAFQLPAGAAAKITVSAVDAFGNPAVLDGEPVFGLSADGIVTLDASGSTAVATSVGTLGTVQVQVSADADLGDGVETIGGLLDIEVVAGKAAVLQVSAELAE